MLLPPDLIGSAPGLGVGSVRGVGGTSNKSALLFSSVGLGQFVGVVCGVLRFALSEPAWKRHGVNGLVFVVFGALLGCGATTFINRHCWWWLVVVPST